MPAEPRDRAGGIGGRPGGGNESQAMGIEHIVSGLVVCVVVLAAAAVYGTVWRRRSGTLREAGARRSDPQPPAAGRAVPSSEPRAAGGAAAGVPPLSDGADDRLAAAGKHTAVLTAAQLGRPLGSRATLVQFSTAFCAPCRATRRILAEVAGMIDGVAHVEVDAEANLGLVRSLGIHATPTVLVLGADGGILRRGTGQPRKPDVIAAIGAVPPRGASQTHGASQTNGGAAGAAASQAGPGADTRLDGRQG
jgi:thiol-disulfide isomerase/thioredoxin